MNTSASEIINVFLFILGFIATFVPLARFVESKWPSRSLIRFSNYGLVPKHTGLLFFIWLAIYSYCYSIIILALSN